MLNICLDLWFKLFFTLTTDISAQTLQSGAILKIRRNIFAKWIKSTTKENVSKAIESWRVKQMYLSQFYIESNKKDKNILKLACPIMANYEYQRFFLGINFHRFNFGDHIQAKRTREIRD